MNVSLVLVPRNKLKDEDKDDVRDNVQKNSQTTECLEKTSQTSTDDSETPFKKPVEVGAEVPDARSLKSEEGAEKVDETGREASSVMRSEDTLLSETCQAIKEEMEMSTTSKPNGESTENDQNTERNESAEDVLMQQREISQKDTCPVKDARQEKNHNKQQLPLKEEPQNLPISGQKEVTTHSKGESGKPSRKTAKDEGM